MNGKDVYFTYNGLNRPAMVRGVPLMLLLSCGFIATFSGFIGVFFLGVFGLVFPLLIGAFLFIVKVIVKTIQMLCVSLNFHLAVCY